MCQWHLFKTVNLLVLYIWWNQLVLIGINLFHRRVYNSNIFRIYLSILLHYIRIKSLILFSNILVYICYVLYIQCNRRTRTHKQRIEIINVLLMVWTAPVYLWVRWAIAFDCHHPESSCTPTSEMDMPSPQSWRPCVIKCSE